MKKSILSIALIVCAALSGMSKNNDPIVMTVGEIEVPLSEFEYLYHKNNAQQLQPMSFDEYVDMFVVYKLKVVDALNSGVDTTQSFKQEYQKFCNDLAMPYLRDASVDEKLIQDTYARMGTERYVSHIMLPNKSQQFPNAVETLDSIRNLILSGQMTFEEAAKKFSVDKRSAVNGGKMAWVNGNSQWPWRFEEAAYNTPVGEISPVVFSGYGYHLIKPLESRPLRGEVNVQHILLLTRGMSPEEVAAQKAKIDSIYAVAIAPGADFETLARKYSQDPGSGKNGGNLGWFGTGKMVQEFDSVSFALADGAISEPFSTSYGYHIVHKLGHRGDVLPALDDVRESILANMQKDDRSTLAMQSYLDQVANRIGAAKNANLNAQLKTWFTENNITKNDSASNLLLESCPIAAYNIGKKQVSVGTTLKEFPVMMPLEGDNLIEAVDASVAKSYREAMVEAAKDELATCNTEYANLSKEYRDGILLFDISNVNVWEKASKDVVGLQNYFNLHRDKYVWDAPRFKGFVVFANSDSVKTQAQEYAKQFDTPQFDEEIFIKEMKDKFGRAIKIEKVVAAQGDNPITDNLGFNAPKPNNLNNRWADYFGFRTQMITAPQEYNDVRGLVVSDYQAELEKEWVKDLHQKYPVKINQKNLKKTRK